MREPEAVAAEPDDPRAAFKAIDPEAILARGDLEARARVGEVDVGVRAEPQGLADRELMTRDGRKERLGAGEPLAVALPALLDLPLVLIDRHAGEYHEPTRAGRGLPTARVDLP